MADEQVEVRTDPGYTFDARNTVEGSPLVTEEGVVVNKDMADKLKAEARSLDLGVRLHFSKVKEGQE